MHSAINSIINSTNESSNVIHQNIQDGLTSNIAVSDGEHTIKLIEAIWSQILINADNIHTRKYLQIIYDFFVKKGMDVIDMSASNKDKDVIILTESAIDLANDFEKKSIEIKEYSKKYEYATTVNTDRISDICSCCLSEIERVLEKLNECIILLQEQKKVSLTQFLLIVSKHFGVIGNWESTKTLTEKLLFLQDNWEMTSEDESFAYNIRNYTYRNLKLLGKDI